MRATLADEKAPLAARKSAFDLLKRDSESAAAFASMLDQESFRAAVIPLLARSQDPAVAAALLKRFAAFNEADRAAALQHALRQSCFRRRITQSHRSEGHRQNRGDLYPDGLFGRGNVGEHGDDQKTARAIMDFVRRGGRLGLVCDSTTAPACPFPSSASMPRHKPSAP